MKTASLVIPGFSEVVYAKGQPEYIPLPAIRSSEGRVTTRWTLSFKERLRLLVGSSVYLQIMTFNKPLQPVRMWVGVPEDFE